MTLNYYVLDKIEKDDFGCTWGYKNGEMLEVFYLSADDTEDELKDQGFAKCDAPNWDETMLIEENSIAQ